MDGNVVLKTPTLDYFQKIPLRDLGDEGSMTPNFTKDSKADTTPPLDDL